MARLIAIPKDDTTLSLLSMAEVGVSKNARRKQIKKLNSVRKKAMRLSAQTKRAMEAVQSLASDKLAEPVGQTSITGITVLDGKPKNLDKIRASMPDHDVIEDMPLTLVRPTKTGTKLAQNQMANIDTWHLEAVQLTRARQSGFSGTGKEVGVAILDTGIKEVPEITGRIKSAFEYDADTDKVVAIATRDTEGHGTHVAGLVAGTRVGIAPEAELMNYIMIPGGNGSMSGFIEAIDHVAGRPEISIMNMSAGIPGYHLGMQVALRALRAAGVLPVIAVGNEGRNTSRSPGNYVEAVVRRRFDQTGQGSQFQR